MSGQTPAIVIGQKGKSAEAESRVKIFLLRVLLFEMSVSVIAWLLMMAARILAGAQLSRFTAHSRIFEEQHRSR